MDSGASRNATPLRIQLPEQLAQGMINSPLDPPPFEPAYARRCVRIPQRIRNHEVSQDVLILTSIPQPVDELLNAVQEKKNDIDIDSDGVSDFSETSSSDEDCDDEGDGGGQEPPQNQGFLEAFLVFWRRPIRENQHGGFSTYIYYAKRLQRDYFGWIDTGEEVAIKAVSWECIRANRNRTSEDFVKEVAALNYLSDGLRGRSIEETHVLTANIVMCNNNHLYIVMPYCDGGDLCMRVAQMEQTRLTEDAARFYFKQILKGLETLQLMRICHRDLSPENLIILENNSLIIDFGMCLRIPYSSAGRHLITPRTPCGKLPHMSPEIYRSRPFDGHAVDIWAAATILLFMLTGSRFSYPPLYDGVLDGADNLGISNGAMDLLKQMLRLDPNNRLTLRQICAHPWMTL